MSLDVLIIKDGVDNVQNLEVVNIGDSGSPLFITCSSPFDQFGLPMFTDSNPGVIGQIGLVVSANFVRPANTTTYSTGQLVANSVTAGSVVPMSLPVARAIGSTTMINRARLTKSSTGVTGAIFRAHLYNVSPTPSNGDGAAWLTNESLAYCSSFTFDMTGAAARVFTDGVKVAAVPDVGTSQLIDTHTVNAIYALIEARGSYVPGSAETFTLALEVTQN